MNVKKILILDFGNIGDIILCTPIFKIIKEKYPNSKVFLLLKEKTHEIVNNNPYIDKVLVFNPSWAIQKNQKYKISALIKILNKH